MASRHRHKHLNLCPGRLKPLKVNHPLAHCPKVKRNCPNCRFTLQLSHSRIICHSNTGLGHPGDSSTQRRLTSSCPRSPGCCSPESTPLLLTWIASDDLNLRDNLKLTRYLDLYLHFPRDLEAYLAGGASLEHLPIRLPSRKKWIAACSTDSHSQVRDGASSISAERKAE